MLFIIPRGLINVLLFLSIVPVATNTVAEQIPGAATGTAFHLHNDARPYVFKKEEEPTTTVSGN